MLQDVLLVITEVDFQFILSFSVRHCSIFPFHIYIEDFETLNYRNFNDMQFSSTKTKHIELIIGQEEFISLSLLNKKEDLNDFNIIS